MRALSDGSDINGGKIAFTQRLGAPSVTALADTAPADGEIAVLFTHDLHSHLLPAAILVDGGESGKTIAMKDFIV